MLETARGGIVRRGLGYDWSDVSVMTNIGPDHIGQDGIESVEDLLYIKSLIAERVREGGTLVLNADDEHLSRLMENPRVSKLEKRVIYFSLRENNSLVARHIGAGHTAYFLRDGLVIEGSDRREYPVLRVADIPCTMGPLEINADDRIFRRFHNRRQQKFGFFGRSRVPHEKI